jgi:hypothetical protein
MDTFNGMVTFGTFLAHAIGFFFRHWQAIGIGIIALGGVGGLADGYRMNRLSAIMNQRKDPDLSDRSPGKVSKSE